MKLKKQLGIILGLVLMFAAFDFSMYRLITRRFINSTSSEMQAKSVEVSKLLPFEENSDIVKHESELTLSGELPVVDGAAALFPMFSAFVNSVYPSDCVEFDGENFTEKSALHYTNTRGAYKAVADGDADVIFCASASEEQLKYAEDKGVELEFVPIGREAFVFFVNSNNPVDSLAVDEVKGIYSGKYTNWKQLGGRNILIDAVQRNEGSGSQTALLKFMGEEKVKKKPFYFTGSSIGFSFRYYISDIAENGGVKMLALNGVYPSKKNITNETYPIVSNFYAVYDKNNDNPNIPVLVDWILSDEGQRIVEESGYAAVN